jgi:acetyl-CoA carboxylase biotin carboxyl carrier protein
MTLSAKPEPAKSPKKNDPAMADRDQRSKTPGPFDVPTVQALVGLMTEHDLSEIDLREGNQRLRLRRGYQPTVASTLAPASPTMQVAAPTPAAVPAKNEPAAPAAPSKPLLEIKSPVVGTFYSAPKPGEPPFVKAGSKVNPDTVVCLIEAMKIFNEIQAECAGVIREVLVDNQQPVEYGQVLFRVDPAG